MGNVRVKGAGDITISARVIRKCGTIEDLGVIAQSKPNSGVKGFFSKLIRRS